jgi:hypothetical protein
LHHYIVPAPGRLFRDAVVPTSNVDAKPVRVNDREQLIYLLTEAAEIEHGLMCSYLYAGWSLKQRIDEGITQPQLDAVDRWRKQIHGVAMEEMLHLALVGARGAAGRRRPVPRRPEGRWQDARLDDAGALAKKPGSEHIFPERLLGKCALTPVSGSSRGAYAATPALCACSSAWYELRTIAPTAACTKPISYAASSNFLKTSGCT